MVGFADVELFNFELFFLSIHIFLSIVFLNDIVEGVSKLSYSKKKSQSPDFHKPGLCYV